MVETLNLPHRNLSYPRNRVAVLVIWFSRTRGIINRDPIDRNGISIENYARPRKNVSCPLNSVAILTIILPVLVKANQ